MHYVLTGSWQTRIPLIYLCYFLFDVILSVANYAAYIRFRHKDYNPDKEGNSSTVNAYLAFVTMGLITYLFVVGVYWCWAALYSQTKEESHRRTDYGLFFLYLSNLLPLWIIEFHIALTYGIHHGFHGFCFAIKTISWALVSLAVWHSYAQRASELLNRYYDYAIGVNSSTQSRSDPAYAAWLRSVAAAPPRQQNPIPSMMGPVEVLDPGEDTYGSAGEIPLSRSSGHSHTEPIWTANQEPPPYPMAASDFRLPGNFVEGMRMWRQDASEPGGRVHSRMEHNPGVLTPIAVSPRLPDFAARNPNLNVQTNMVSTSGLQTIPSLFHFERGRLDASK